MAAYASVVSLSQTMQHFLRHEYDHPQLPTALVGQIVSLQEHVNLSQAFLEDDKTTTDLEDRIRDASNVVEDMLEYSMLEHFQDARSKYFPFVRWLKGLWEELKLTYNSQRLGSIVAEMMSIKNMTTTRHVGEMTGNKNNTARVEFGDSSTSRLPPSIGKDEIMVGFDDDLLAIKSRLCGNSSRLEIIPICGMGGIGKTTLAKNAYEDPSTVHRFHVRAWVTVSQDYKGQEVLSRLQVSMKAFIGERNGRGDEVVYKSLKGRRYLIVLDDMWSTEVWDDVKRLFPDDSNGSRILLTTRLVDVAAYADSSSNHHQVHLMDEDRSWQLLQQKVFEKEPCPPQLEDTGMAIARRCKGLPLAIVVVAGILSTISPTKASWEEVASKISSTFNANDNEITKIFSLSYTNLPHHLRSCLLYMGGFPEDYEIHVTKLVKLWTAEGFMKPRGSKCFEDVGEEYLEDLVKRSLVLVMTRKSNGRIKSCSVHDLLRDLCIRKAEQEKFLVYITNLDTRRNLHQRRLIEVDFLNMDSIERYRFDFHNMDSIERYAPTTHSVLSFFGYPQFSCLKRFRLLRVLDATKSKFEKFPEDVLELYLLRYLALSIENSVDLIDIPPSISELKNLQTLLICPFDRLRYFRVRFPLEIWSLRRLRHLHVVGCLYTTPFPELYPTSFALQDLQTLVTARNFRCSDRVLQMIQNIKKLAIYYDYGDYPRGELINVAEEYHLQNLVHLRHLEKLRIHTIEDCVLGIELRFPTMLKKLKLVCLKRLSKQVMGIIGSSPNLEVLKLDRCNFEDDMWETTEGEFPKLKVLKIYFSNLKEWMTGYSHFPSLKHLHLSGCYGLREILEEIGEIPTLELIEVDRMCERSLVESVERIKEEQENYGNDSFQVRINWN